MAVARGPADLTVIVPAFNEADWIADTIRWLQGQALLPKEMADGRTGPWPRTWI
jgi:hypothetical protein